jgi:type I restriction enzyme, R subunit
MIGTKHIPYSIYLNIAPEVPIGAFPEKYERCVKKGTEANNLNGFASPIPGNVQLDRHKFLKVAYKCQTCYGEMLLHGMKAGQFPSRLNRAYPQQYDTFVLDFYNDSGNLKKSITLHFRTSTLGEISPRTLHDFKSGLDGYQVDAREQTDDLLFHYLSSADRATSDLILWIHRRLPTMPTSK